MADAEHDEWLRDEEERKKLHKHPHHIAGEKTEFPNEGVKQDDAEGIEEEEAQEVEDDVADDAADEAADALQAGEESR